mmetsp:Transcript_56637/g.123121  ORF Transcript_56637/g.123121 Transcript_56637/m.123121 type:complete len:454 (-) Transcript_56637:502-1863(-)
MIPISPASLAESPFVLLLMAVMQRLDLLIALAFGELVGIACLEIPRRDLDQPLGLDLQHLSHVLARRQHEVVVHHPLGVLIEEGRRRVYVHGLAIAQRLVSLLCILFASVHEVPRGDAFANPVVVATARRDLQLVTVEDGEELLADVLCPLQRTRMHKVLETPGVGVFVVLPALVDGEEAEVVALGLVELALLLVGLGLLLLGPVEDVLHAQHADDGEHLVAAAKVHRGEEDLGQLRLQRELGHLPPQLGQQPLLVQRPQRIQRLHRHDQRLDGRGVHKVKVDDVVDAHGLEREHRVAEVGPLDLRHRRRQHLVAERRLRVQPIALAGSRAAGASHALSGRRLRHGGDDEGVHARFRVVDLLLGEAGVDDVEDAVDGERGLGDVGRDDTLPLPRRTRVEDTRLHLGRERRVHRVDVELGDELAERLAAFEEDLTRGVDLLLPREEEQDVAGGL